MIIKPLHTFAKHYTENIKNDITPRLERTLGIKIRYNSISPSVLSSITVLDLEMKFNTGVFSAKKVRIRFNPLKALRQKEKTSLQWISGMTIFAGHLNLEIANDASFFSTRIQQKHWAMLNSKTLRLIDFSSTISSERWGNVHAQNFEINVESYEDYIRYSLSGYIENDNTLFPESLGIVESKISSTGGFSPLKKEYNGRIDVIELNSNLLTLKSISANLAYNNGLTRFHLIGDDQPFDITAEISENKMTLDGQFVDFSLDELAGPGYAKKILTPWFKTVVNGKFGINWYPRESDIQYNLDMSFSLHENAGLPWPWDVSASLSGNGKEITIHHTKINLPQASALYYGKLLIDGLYPTGTLSVNWGNWGNDLPGYPVSGSFHVFNTNGVTIAEAKQFTAGNIEFDTFDLLVEREFNRIVASLSVVPASISGIPDVNNNTKFAFFDVMLETGDWPMIYGSVSINGLETAHAVQLLDAGILTNMKPIRDSFVNIQGTFMGTPQTWKAQIDEAMLISRSNPTNRIAFRGQLTPNNLSLDNIYIAWNDFYAIGNGFANNNTRGGTAEGRLLVDNEMFPIEATWSHNGSIWIAVSDQINTILGPPTLHGRSLITKANQLIIPIKGGSIQSNFELNGSVSRKNWSIAIVNSEFHLSKSDIFHSVKLQGQIQEGLIDLSHIEYEDNFGVIYGRAELKNITATNKYIANIEMLSEKEESVYLTADLSNRNLNIDLTVNTGKLERLNISGLRGFYDLQANLAGSLDNPTVSVEFSTSDAFNGDSPFHANGNLELQEKKLSLGDLEILYNGISISNGLVLTNFDTGSIRGTANVHASYNQVPVATGLSVGLDFNQPITIQNFRSIEKADYTGTLATHAVMWNNTTHLPPFTFQFSKNSEQMLVQTPDKKTLNAVYTFTDGQFSIMSGNPLPIKLIGGGTINGNYLDLSFSTISIDPVLINYIMLQDPILLQYHVVFQEGQLTGNLDINGYVSSPELFGLINVFDLKVDTPYTYAEILPTNSRVRFNGNRIIFERIEVPVGNGIAYGEGYMVLKSWKITEMDLSYGCLPTDNGDGVPISYPLMGVYLEGLATADIHMSGGGSNLILDGDIRFPLLKISLGSSRIPDRNRKRKRKRTVNVNFRLETGENCTFFLPNEQLKIVSATAQSNQALELQYVNNPNTLTLTGSIPIISGGVYYLDRNFKISEGQIIFDEGLQNFDPEMQIRAEVLVRDEQNEEVQVALIYDAPVRSQFNPTIETVPPRSENELLALFGQAVLPSATDTSGPSQIQAILASTGGMLTKTGIVQPFENAIRKGLNLDMVTIRTDIIENALAERLEQSNTLAEATEFSGLGRYLDNTNLYIGKYIGDALFASGSLTVRYFEENQYKSVFGGLEFETAFSFEMATPFFNVEWSFAPDLEFKRTFIADNSITLKWQFTY